MAKDDIKLMTADEIRENINTIKRIINARIFHSFTTADYSPEIMHDFTKIDEDEIKDGKLVVKIKSFKRNLYETTWDVVPYFFAKHTEKSKIVIPETDEISLHTRIVNGTTTDKGGNLSVGEMIFRFWFLFNENPEDLTRFEKEIKEKGYSSFLKNTYSVIDDKPYSDNEFFALNTALNIHGFKIIDIVSHPLFPDDNVRPSVIITASNNQFLRNGENISRDKISDMFKEFVDDRHQIINSQKISACAESFKLITNEAPLNIVREKIFNDLEMGIKNKERCQEEQKRESFRPYILTRKATDKKYLVRKNVITVGSSKEGDVDILIDNKAVSKRHAKLEMAEDKAILITDLGSANGTFLISEDGSINDRMLSNEAYELKYGDTIVFANEEFEYKY